MFSAIANASENFGRDNAIPAKAEQLEIIATKSIEMDFPAARLSRFIGVISMVLRKPFSLSPAIEFAARFIQTIYTAMNTISGIIPLRRFLSIAALSTRSYSISADSLKVNIRGCIAVNITVALEYSSIEESLSEL